MSWYFKKKINFDPKIYFGDKVIGYCKSPQIVNLFDLKRVYCCVAVKDKNKVKSVPIYIDFDPSFQKIIEISNLDLIPAASLGAFDEHGIFPFSPFKLGNTIVAFTTGWSRRKSVDIDLAVGLVESKDNGHSFERNFGSGPLLAGSYHEPFLIGDAFVRFFEEKYHMWYIFGNSWLESEGGIFERNYKIAHATSRDMISWERDSKYCFPNEPSTCEAHPSVTYFDDKYHMVYCLRNTFDFRSNGPTKNAYKLFHAVSENLSNWSVVDGSFAKKYSSFDSHMQCYPHIFIDDGKMCVLYNGNNFGIKDFGLLEWSLE